MKTHTSLFTNITYTTAIGLALFSGAVSTYGLTKFAPGAEIVIAAMGLLFEAGKLAAFTLIHHRMPVPLKSALLAVGLVLMTLNIVGVSGFLSNAYEHEQTAIRAASHTVETEARAAVATLERQSRAAETAVTEARAALGKAKGDRDQIKAVNTVIASATAERDRIAGRLAAAQAKQAQTEGATIAASGEFAAIAFIAAATGASQDFVAHLVILVIASLPDVLAVLLLLAAGFTHAPAPAAAEVVTVSENTKPKLTAAQKAAKKGWETRRRNQARKTGPQLAYTH